MNMLLSSEKTNTGTINCGLYFYVSPHMFKSQRYFLSIFGSVPSRSILPVKKATPGFFSNQLPLRKIISIEQMGCCLSGMTRPSMWSFNMIFTVGPKIKILYGKRCGRKSPIYHEEVSRVSFLLKLNKKDNLRVSPNGLFCS